MKAATWEEVELLAQNNEYLQDAVSGIPQLTEDEMIRQQCIAREKYYYWKHIDECEQQRELQERDNIILQR